MENSRILIDSNIIIDHFRRKQKSASKLEKVFEHFSIISISTITVFEIEIGAKLANRSSDIKALLPYFDILDVTLSVSEEGASIFAELKRNNKLLDFRDILIAATARFHKIPLLTTNI